MKATHADLLLAMVTAAGAAGLCTSAAQGMTVPQADAAARKLLERGLIWRSKLGHRTVRYFAQAGWAEAHQAQRQSAYSPGPGPAPTKRARAQWAPDQEAIYPTNPDGTPAYKITVGPGPKTHPKYIRTSSYEP